MTLPALAAAGLELVPLALADVEAFHRLLVQPDVRRYLMDDRAIDRTAAGELVRAGLALAPRGLGAWRIATGEAPWAGAVALQPVAATPGYRPTVPPDAVEVLIVLDPPCWGRGIATRAVRAVEAHAADVGLTALHALIDVPNHRSRRLFDQLGYRVLGRVTGVRHDLDVLARALGVGTAQ